MKNEEKNQIQQSEPIKILIIDDEQGILDLLSFELRSRGYEVVAVTNGQEGLEKIKKENFNIVISDVKMPKINGLQVLEIIKKINPSIEVIMTTGFGTIDIAVDCMKKGAYDFISKPYNLDELFSHIEKAYEKQRLSLEITSLKELHKLKSEFLAATSHELRTPMNAIIGYTALMLEKVYGNLTDKQEMALKRISINAGNLIGLINNILDISKLTANKIVLFVEKFNLKDVLAEVIAMTESLAREKNIFLNLEKMNNIILKTDKTRMKQVLINLVGNAIKFTNQGGVTISIKKIDTENNDTQNAQNSEMIKIDIKDTGIGIKPEFINIIFEEFTQVDTSTTKEYGGTGLGLAIAKKLVELMGGKITVESEFGQGSIFSVLMPIQKGDTEVQEGSEYMEQLIPLNTPENEKIFLGIDDDADVHNIIKDSLVGTDFKYVGATNADEGIMLAKQLKPYIIGIDVFMPHRDGWSILQSLKNDPETWAIPIIIMSAQDNRSIGFSMGITDYLLKPFERKTLLERIGRLETIKNKRILVVDDDKELNMVVQMLLSSAGYNVISAFSGEEALTSIERDHPDIILLDLMMPGVTGFDIIDTIQLNPEYAHIRVIVMTAKVLTKTEIEEINKRAELVIEKSSKSIKEILSAIKERVESNKQEK